MQHRQLPEGWDKDLPTFPADAKGLAGRDASAKVLNALAKNVPWLIGGSADLAPSTKTRLTFDGAGDFSAATATAAATSTSASASTPWAPSSTACRSRKCGRIGSGFLIFSDYARAAIRLSALMEIPVIYIFTHDSIGVGEDGPTHQPVEHWPRCAPFPGLDRAAPGGCQRSRRGLARRSCTCSTSRPR